VSRNQAGSSWIAKAVVFSLSSALAGGLTGTILGAIGASLSYGIRVALISLLAIPAVALGGIELLGHRLQPLQCDRETPQEWVRLGPLRWAMYNGMALGSGAWSRIGFWLWYVVPIGAFLVGRPLLSAALYGTYGLARGAAVWAIMLGIVQKRRGYARWLLGRATLARTVAAGILVLIGVVAISAVGL